MYPYKTRAHSTRVTTNAIALLLLLPHYRAMGAIYLYLLCKTGIAFLRNDKNLIPHPSTSTALPLRLALLRSPHLLCLTLISFALDRFVFCWICFAFWLHLTIISFFVMELYTLIWKDTGATNAYITRYQSIWSIRSTRFGALFCLLCSLSWCLITR